MTRITKEEREEISRLLSQRISLCSISKILGRNKSTMSREVRRNGMTRYTYRAFKANIHARREKSKAGRKLKLEKNIKLRRKTICCRNKHSSCSSKCSRWRF